MTPQRGVYKASIGNEVTIVEPLTDHGESQGTQGTSFARVNNKIGLQHMMKSFHVPVLKEEKILSTRNKAHKESVTQDLHKEGT